MHKGIVILIVVIVVIAMVAGFFIWNEGKKKEGRVIENMDELGKFLGMNMNDQVQVLEMEWEYRDSKNGYTKYATELYLHLKVKKAYLTSDAKLRNSEAHVEGISFDAAYRIFDGHLAGFQQNRLDYVKSLFKNFTIYKSPFERIKTSQDVMFYVEKAESGQDDVDCYLFTIAPDKIAFDKDKILSGA